MERPNYLILPRIERSYWLCALSFLGFIFSLLAFWPGFMEYDSFYQYGQAIGADSLTDWHPISMTLLWRALLFIHDGPVSPFFLQVVLYWAGFLYLSICLYRRTASFPLALGAVIVPFSPFLINFLGVIWKDTHLALSLFWASLLLCFGGSSKSRLIISIIFIFYGLSVRHNGLFAALPLLVLWSDRYSNLLGIHNKFRLPIITVGITMFYFLLNLIFSQFILFERTSPLNAQLLNEIAYIQSQTDSIDLDLPHQYYGDNSQKIEPKLRKKYLLDHLVFLASNSDTNIISDEDKILQAPDYKDRNIKKLWFHDVIAHPFLYLKYRFIVYKTFLRPLSYANPCLFFFNGLDEQESIQKSYFSYIKLPMRVANSFGTTRLLADYISLSARSFHVLFRPLFWLITLFLTVGFSIFQKNKAVFLVSLSGLLYLLMYFFFLPAPDFRYCYYSIFAQVLAAFLLLDQQFKLPVPSR